MRCATLTFKIGFVLSYAITMSSCGHREPPVSDSHRNTVASESSAQYEHIDLNWLGNFPFDRWDRATWHIPDDRLHLSGKHVALVGYMSYVDGREEPIRRFALTPAGFDWDHISRQLQKVILVQSPPGEPLPTMETDFVCVYGTLSAGIVYEDKEPYCFFQLKADRIEPIRPGGS